MTFIYGTWLKLGYFLEQQSKGENVDACKEGLGGETEGWLLLWRREWDEESICVKEREKKSHSVKLAHTHWHTHADSHTHKPHIRDTGAETGRILLQILFPLGLSTGENKPTRGTANGDLLINYLHTERNAHLLRSLPPSLHFPRLRLLVVLPPRSPARCASGTSAGRVIACG